MANYYATTRSNYFAVIDPDAFKEQMETLGVGVFEQVAADGSKTFAVYGRDGEDGQWPSMRAIGDDDIPDDFEEIDFMEVIQNHLVPDGVAVLIEIGFEKLRYLTGFGTVVTKEDIATIDLIEATMELARSTTGKTDISRPEY